MGKAISHVFIVLFLTISISAQETQPELVDQFGNIPLGETMARIDALAVMMVNSPDSKALVRIYGGQKDAFGAPYWRGSIIKGYWAHSRRYAVEKLLIQFCNINKEPIQTDFFIVRKNDKVEACAEDLTMPQETVRFENLMFYSSGFKLVPQDDTAVEYGIYDGEYSVFAHNVLKKLLKASPESKIYVVTYLRTEKFDDKVDKMWVNKDGSDKQSVSKKMMKGVHAGLIRDGFPPSQIVTIDGGYLNNTQRIAEVWFVPPGGEIPKPKPDYVPKKRI